MKPVQKRSRKQEQPRRRFLEKKFYDPWTADGTKAFDLRTTAAVANSAGAYILDTAAAPGAVVLNQIPQGVTQNTRLGRRARMTAVHIKGYFQSTTNSSQATVLSVNLIHQTTPSGPSAMPAYNTIWVAQNAVALRNVNDSSKIKIIKSILVQIAGDYDAATTGLEQHIVDEMIDLKQHDVITEWTQADTTGVYGNMETGALLLYGLSTSTATNSFYGSVRVYYEDY